MPQFSLARLLVSVSIMAVGFALIGAVLRFSPLGFQAPFSTAICSLMLGTSIVGAGVGNIFRRRMLGAIIGFALMDAGLIVASFLGQA